MTDMQAEAQQQVVGVRFTKIGKLYHFDYSEFPDLTAGEFVIVETARGRHMGQIMGFTVAEPGTTYHTILRPATPRDIVLRQEWEAKQPEALVVCREMASRIRSMRDVKFVAAQYNYDGSVLTFLYSAEQKVSVNVLWNRLRRSFEATVEMRQIGPRDVAKLLGGYGACGELRCCSTFLTDFSPISIKMAKMQGISLNPSEITGMCGRLRCCLVYEYEQYVEARKQLPRRNKRVGTPHGPGRVIEVNPLQDIVTVWVDNEGRFTVHREDIVPIEELEALQKKAQEPCSKHGPDEACSCGQKPGNRNQDKAEEVTAAAEPEGEESSKPQQRSNPRRNIKDKDGDDKKNKKRRNNNRRRGGRGRRGGNRNKGGDNSNQDSNQKKD